LNGEGVKLFDSFQRFKSLKIWDSTLDRKVIRNKTSFKKTMTQEILTEISTKI